MGSEMCIRDSDIAVHILFLNQLFEFLIVVGCYIVNTGDFMGKKVKPADTLGILEAIVEKKADFHQWGPFSDIEIMDWEGFVPDMNDPEYVSQLKARMNDRVNEIKEFAVAKEGYDKLPDDALEALERVVKELN